MLNTPTPAARRPRPPGLTSRKRFGASRSVLKVCNTIEQAVPEDNSLCLESYERSSAKKGPVETLKVYPAENGAEPSPPPPYGQQLPTHDIVESATRHEPMYAERADSEGLDESGQRENGSNHWETDAGITSSEAEMSEGQLRQKVKELKQECKGLNSGEQNSRPLLLSPSTWRQEASAEAGPSRHSPRPMNKKRHSAPSRVSAMSLPIDLIIRKLQEESEERIAELQHALAEARDGEEAQRKAAARFRKEVDKLQRDLMKTEERLSQSQTQPPVYPRTPFRQRDSERGTLDRRRTPSHRSSKPSQLEDEAEQVGWGTTAFPQFPKGSIRMKPLRRTRGDRCFGDAFHGKDPERNDLDEISAAIPQISSSDTDSFDDSFVLPDDRSFASRFSSVRKFVSSNLGFTAQNTPEPIPRRTLDQELELSFTGVHDRSRPQATPARPRSISTLSRRPSRSVSKQVPKLDIYRHPSPYPTEAESDFESEDSGVMQYARPIPVEISAALFSLATALSPTSIFKKASIDDLKLRSRIEARRAAQKSVTASRSATRARTASSAREHVVTGQKTRAARADSMESTLGVQRRSAAAALFRSPAKKLDSPSSRAIALAHRRLSANKPHSLKAPTRSRASTLTTASLCRSTSLRDLPSGPTTIPGRMLHDILCWISILAEYVEWIIILLIRLLIALARGPEATLGSRKRAHGKRYYL